MQAKHFRWVFLPIAVVLFLWSFTSSDSITIGVSAEWSGASYHFSGGTHPGALMLAAGIIGFYLFLLYAPPTTPGGPVPGVFRRFVALYIDFMIGALAIAPVLGIIPTILEWRRTGEFAWTFERDTAASYDWWIAFPLVLVMFAALVLYFAWPLVRRVPSPGACVMGYQILGDAGTEITWRKAILRTLLGFIAACACYLAPFVARDRKRGKFWLDKVFATHAERLV